MGQNTSIFSDWLGASAPEVAANLEAGFSGHLKWNKDWNGVKQGVHILPRVQCSSLVAVRVPKANLSFEVAFNKLKATLDDGTKSITSQCRASASKALKEAWRNAGLVAVDNALPMRGEIHVRVGLARPFADPPKCYAMLNGVL